MTVYLGDKAVGANTIVEKEVAKTKFGTTIDNFFGNVDADGNYIAPSEPFEVNLAGVKSVPSMAFWGTFEENKNITKFTANDLISFTGIEGNTFRAAFKKTTNLILAEFNSIEEIPNNSGANYAFYQTFQNINKDTKVHFNKLKKIAAAGCFYGAFSGFSGFKPDEVFPVLEEISGNEAMRELCTYIQIPTLLFSRVKKITGATSKVNCTFGGIYNKDTVWNFPSATEMTGYIWNSNASYAGEIHFAAANQAAIEACEGYDYKWGFDGATIYFDL